MTRRGLLLIATALALCSGAAVVAAAPVAAARLPVIPGSRTGRSGFDPLVRPASLVYAGDGSGALGGFDGHGRDRFGHFTWTTWTARIAQGHGANWIDTCHPDCAAGRFFPHSATATAFRPRGGHFTRLRIRTRESRHSYSFTVAITGSGRHLGYGTLG